MTKTLELGPAHFKKMRKQLSEVEKAWGMKALGEMKEKLDELKESTEETENVIKNTLYFNLKAKGDGDGTTHNNQGRRD